MTDIMGMTIPSWATADSCYIAASWKPTLNSADQLTLGLWRDSFGDFRHLSEGGDDVDSH